MPIPRFLAQHSALGLSEYVPQSKAPLHFPPTLLLLLQYIYLVCTMRSSLWYSALFLPVSGV